MRTYQDKTVNTVGGLKGLMDDHIIISRAFRYSGPGLPVPSSGS